MPLHPQAKAILEALAAEGGKPMEEMTPQEVRTSRAQHTEALAAMAGPLSHFRGAVREWIPGPGGPIPVRIYWPLAGKSLPALVYLHGGGWVFGNIDSVDRNCRVLANTVEMDPVMGSEDFGLFGTAAGVPSVFWGIGGSSDDAPANHSPSSAGASSEAQRSSRQS